MNTREAAYKMKRRKVNEVNAHNSTYNRKGRNKEYTIGMYNSVTNHVNRVTVMLEGCYVNHITMKSVGKSNM